MPNLTTVKAQARWTGSVLQRMERHAQGNMRAAARIVVKAAKKNLWSQPAGAGARDVVRRSLRVVGYSRGSHYRAAGGSYYWLAKAWEDGAFVPKRARARAMAIPVSEEAKQFMARQRDFAPGQHFPSPRGMPGLEMVTRPGKAPLLVRPQHGGNWKARASDPVMFVLKPSVQIKRHSYMKGAIAATRSQCEAAIKGASRHGTFSGATIGGGG